MSAWPRIPFSVLPLGVHSPPPSQAAARSVQDPFQKELKCVARNFLIVKVEVKFLFFERNLKKGILHSPVGSSFTTGPPINSAFPLLLS